MPKKLFKDSSNAKICGVCAGLAEYLNLDVTLIRILAVLFMFLSSFSLVIVYFICSFIMPDKSELY